MWPWKRKRDDAMTPRNVESTAARIRAERDLERREMDTYRIQRITAEWRRIRETNNIAAAFEDTMRGRHA